MDRIVIVNTWHHIAERRSYTKRLLAALKPGGTIAVIDYTRDSPRGPPAKHRLSPEQVVAELNEGGAKASVLIEDLPLQYIVVGLP